MFRSRPRDHVEHIEQRPAIGQQQTRPPVKLAPKAFPYVLELPRLEGSFTAL